MGTRNLAAALGALQFIFLLSACGELETVFPSSGTYRVDALVNEISLEDCAVIGEGSRIRPYFVNSVAGDPDVRGLTVYLQGPGGRPAGGKIQYALSAGEEQPAPVLPEEEKPPVEPEIPLKPEAEEPPGAGLEEDALSGEPEGEPKNEENRQPALFSIPAPPPKKEVFLEMDAEDHPVPVVRLDADLPPFVLPQGLEIGRYTLVFQVQGEREALYRIDKPFYFTADAEFSIGDVHSYLPGFFAGSPLIPPGTTVLLEARIAADQRLDPYVIWYNGRRRIGEGFLSEGINRIMWKTPEQTGFHNVRAELFPFKPLGPGGGRVKELSLPVSSKHEALGYFSEPGTPFIHRYHLGGNLQDFKNPGLEQALWSREDTLPRWLPGSGIYGLVLERGDVYTLPGSPFILGANQQGKGQVRLRFKPLGAGILLKALFKAGSSSQDALEMSLFSTGKALWLKLQGGGETQTTELGAELFEQEHWVALSLNFSLRETVFTAALTLENSFFSGETLEITLPEELSGEGTLQFGAVLRENPLPSSPEEEEPGRGTASRISAAGMETAILDEIALSFTREPILSPAATGEETGAAEENLETPQEEIPVEETSPPSPESAEGAEGAEPV
jgi:hypothetical protein